MEKRDLVDKNRKYIGETTITESNITEGKYIQIVIMCIENDKNEFLIQKRALKKNGKWALTGGHVISGEDSVTAVLRETQEELGLELEENEVELIFGKRAYDCFVDIYYIKKDIELSNLKLEKEEVENVEWANLKQIRNLKENGTFLEYHYNCLKECIYFIKEVEEEKKRCIN